MRDYDISNGKISDCCNGKRKSAGGYRWSYKKCGDIGNCIYETNSRTVHKYSLTGEYLKTYDHLTDAVKEMNLKSGGHISSCCNGNREVAYGFMWSYEKKDNISPTKNTHNQGVGVIQYDLNMNIINRFANSIDASKQFGGKRKKLICQ